MKPKILSLVLLSFLYGSAYAQYCSISGRAISAYIERIQLGSIDKTSGDNNGYADYTALSTSIVAGSSQTITATPGIKPAVGPVLQYWNVYIDYNQDGDFTDAGENAGSATWGSATPISFTVPPSALPGNTRMRIVMKLTTGNSTCGDIGDGEAEDYTVQIACPVPTGLSASNINNNAAMVSWAGGAAKYKLQYKIAGTSTWTAVNNITNTNYTLTGLTQNTKYSYRVQAICAPGSTSAFSATASFTTTNNYCGTGGSTEYGYINRVKLGSIDNTSGDNGGYADYTALSISIGTGTSQTISLTPGGLSRYYWEVYIDYNQDIDFTDPGEKVGQGDGNGPVDISFTAPATVLTGNTRMRVIMKYGDGYLNNPCTYFFGEAEDYTVKVTTCNVPTNLTASSISADAATVSWKAAAGAKKYKLQYRTGTNPWTSVDNITDTFYKLTGLAVHTGYNYKVQSLCGAGLKSAFSSTASFTTTFAYCPVEALTDYEWIEKVKLGSIDNTSGNNGGYKDYTSLSTSMAAGSLQKITLTPGFTNNPDEEYWQVYIDYNQDGDFYDAGEAVGQARGTTASNKNISFTVPVTALNGSTRMRVRMNFDFYRDDPCDVPGDQFGEIEDYTVAITGGALKAAAVNAVAANNARQNALNSLVVSPNPVNTSSANLKLQTAKAGMVTIKILDLSGKIVRSENIHSVIVGTNTYALRNLNLLPGPYMIVAIQGNAIVGRTQFIIAK